MDRCIDCGLVVEICGQLSSGKLCQECGKAQADCPSEDDVDFSLLENEIKPENWKIFGMYSQFKREN